MSKCWEVDSLASQVESLALLSSTIEAVDGFQWEGDMISFSFQRKIKQFLQKKKKNLSLKILTAFSHIKIMIWGCWSFVSEASSQFCLQEAKQLKNCHYFLVQPYNTTIYLFLSHKEGAQQIFVEGIKIAQGICSQ